MSSTGIVEGKALLVLRREHEDGEQPCYEVHSFIQTAVGGDFAHECARQDFDLLVYDTLPVPNAAKRLRPGDTLRVHVVYEFEYTCDYWGEHDVTLLYRKERVRRIQRYRERYISKADREIHTQKAV